MRETRERAGSDGAGGVTGAISCAPALPAQAITTAKTIAATAARRAPPLLRRGDLPSNSSAIRACLSPAFLPAS